MSTGGTVGRRVGVYAVDWALSTGTGVDAGPVVSDAVCRTQAARSYVGRLVVHEDIQHTRPLQARLHWYGVFESAYSSCPYDSRPCSQVKGRYGLLRPKTPQPEGEDTISRQAASTSYRRHLRTQLRGGSLAKDLPLTRGDKDRKTSRPQDKHKRLQQ